MSVNITEVTVDAILTELKSGQLSGAANLLFVVDIGASNCRFGLAKRGNTQPTILFVKFSDVKSIPKLLAEMSGFAETVGDDVCRRITGAALNLPGPVNGAIGGPIANYAGATSAEKMLHLKDLPKKLCPLHRTVMMNDLEACAYGVVAANRFEGVFKSFFQTLWLGTEASDSDRSKNFVEGLPSGHCLVVAPGTGLGQALVQFHSFSGKYSVLPLEFGHCTVQSHTDTEFLETYGKAMGRGPFLPEYDDICSGRGLEALYRFIASTSANTPAPVISSKAKAGDPLAMEAVRKYHRFLMRYSSQMAIGFVPSAIILCGDNVVHNEYFYANHANVKEMRASLLEHSMERMGFMSRPHVLRQRVFANLNLLGCLHVADEAARMTSKL